MKTLKTIVIEDEKRNQSLILQYIKKHFQTINVVEVCESVETSIEAINKHQPDLLIADIELPDGNLFDVLHQLPKPVNSLIIITAFNQYAIKAIKYSALDYLLKPIMLDELKEAIKKCETKLSIITPSINGQVETMAKHSMVGDVNLPLAIGDGNKVRMVKTSEILYLKAEKNYTDIILISNEKLTICKPLSHFEQMLSPRYFFRTHNSYMVNLFNVKSLKKGRTGTVIMCDGTEIEVAARRIKDFTTFLNNFSKFHS